MGQPYRAYSVRSEVSWTMIRDAYWAGATLDVGGSAMRRRGW